MIRILFGIILAYLIGSIPTGFLMGKIKGIDVRQVGSGNVGATNVLRAVGKLPALIALIVDVIKGVIAVTIVALLFYVAEMPIGLNFFKAILGFSAIAGHNWTIFLKFKGGKGVATSLGVLIILLPKATVIGVLVFLATLWLTRYVSLGSILMSVAIPIAAAIMARELEFIILAITLCILISYRHKENIKRLIRGTENKIGTKLEVAK